MKNVFVKETLRTIRHSLGRFLAIVVIVAVGCGFFAGLRMSGSGMRKSADAYAKQTSLYDIQLTSTLGITQSTVDIVKTVQGVGEIMCTKSIDTMAQVEEYNHEIRLTSLDIQKAKSAAEKRESFPADASSQNEQSNLLNQPTLVSGRWPETSNECVLLYREAIPEQIGQTIQTLYGAQTLDGTLEARQFSVVGYVKSPAYLDTATVSTTSLGSGSLWGVAFVLEDAFASDAPYTELFITVPAARDEIFGTPEYFAHVQDVKDDLNARLDDIANARRQEVQAKAQEELDKSIKTYNNKRTSVQNTLADAEQKIHQAERSLASSLEQIEQAKTLLNNNKSKLEAAYAAGLIPKEQYLEQMQAIVSQEQALEASAAKLEEGAQQLAQQKAAFEQQKVTATKELQNAKRQLDEAQANIDSIAKPDIYVMDRDQNYGAYSFKSDSERIDSIATLFPFFFFIVAALVALTTMMRMVEDDRSLIGTFKALGYSNARIATKYLFYAGIASLAGALIGIACMSQLLPGVILKAYSIIYAVPERSFPLPVEIAPALAALVLGVSITLAATLGACVASFRESPATLMLPKAPKPGKRILLERIRPLWRRLSFSWKVTLRNIFRYKTRFLMTAIGVAGCTMLLVTGFGVRDAINDIINNQFGETTYDSTAGPDTTKPLAQETGITRYNTTIDLADPPDADSAQRNVQTIADYLKTQNSVEEIASLTSQNLVAHTQRDGNQNHSIQLECPQDLPQFAKLNNLRVRTTQEPLKLEEQSAILTEKIATTLGIEVGDRLALYDQDLIGNPTGDPRYLTITGICENYLGSYIFVGEGAYQQAFSKTPLPNTIICNIDGSADERNAIANHIQTMENVDTIRYNDELIDRYRDMLRSVDLVMVVLIIAAMILAFVVLYNLANINIAERVREIASLKVLGFRRREVAAYVFREILMIVFFGTLAGLVLGWGFESYVVVTAEVDAAMFGRIIHLSSYLYSFGLTMLFAAFVCLSMLPKLALIDMVESLKSVD